MATQRKSIRKKIIFLIGPTAVGKTEVAIRLAKSLNAEIISCDSMQVYKDIDIISQKPTPSQLKQIPHHLINIISCAENFSAADFRKRALKVIDRIYKKKKIPIFVGGTALYFKILIDGLFSSPDPDFKLRQKLEKEAKSINLHARLKKIDPVTAGILHPNDSRRIIRALEVYEKTGVIMSELKKKTKGLGRQYDIRIFCLSRSRELLYERINKRVDTMFRKGAVAECRRLKKKELSVSASKILGFRDIAGYIDKKCTKLAASENLKQNTRRFAKRQLSWFRNDPRIKWVNISEGETASEIAEKIIQENNIERK